MPGMVRRLLFATLFCLCAVQAVAAEQADIVVTAQRIRFHDMALGVSRLDLVDWSHGEPMRQVAADRGLDLAIDGSRLTIRAATYGVRNCSLAVGTADPPRTLLLAVRTWLPFTVAGEGFVRVGWDQFPADRSTGERQFDVTTPDHQPWIVPWWDPATIRDGSIGTGVFGQDAYDAIMASKIPFRTVWADLHARGARRHYVLTNFVPIPAGVPFKIETRHPDEHPWIAGWSTNVAIQGGDPLFQVLVQAVAGEVWLLPPGSGDVRQDKAVEALPESAF